MQDTITTEKAAVIDESIRLKSNLLSASLLRHNFGKLIKKFDRLLFGLEIKSWASCFSKQNIFETVSTRVY